MKGIKTVKRFLLAYVILAMACMGIMTNYTTAEAATTFKTWECYKADYYLQCSPYSYYMSDKFSAPYRSIVKENSTSDVFNGLLTSWEIATFSLSNVTEYSQKRTGYYEAFLYDVLYQGYDQKTLMGALKKGAKSTQASALKSVTKLLKKTEMSYGKTKLASMSDEEMKNFAKSLKECNELSAVFGVVSDVTTVFSYATTVEEVLYKASKAATIMNTASENADILDRIANATTDASLKKACNNLASICRKEVSEDELVQIMLKDEAVDEIQNKVMSKIWSKVIEQLGTYGIAVKAGQSLGKAFAELFFSTNTQVETYYEMKCLYEFEDRLTDAVRTYAANYSSNATTANAKLFNNAFEMLMQTYELGCDIAVTYNESTYDKGALNILVSRISGNIDKFNKYKDSVNFIKRTIDEVYTFATNDMYNSYLEDCCADVADAVEMAPVENVGTKEELDNQLVALEANVQKASNMYISDDYKLTGDIETYGSLYLSGGTLDLNGYTLTIHGDIHQTNGVLFVNGGKLTVDGDYGIYRTRKNSTTGDTEIDETSGYLKMVKAADSITVGGNLTVCINKDTRGYLTAGTLVLKGNFRQVQLYNTSGSVYEYTAYGFCATGTQTTILAGEGTQELSFESSASGFNELKTAEGYQGKIAFKNNIKFNKLGSDLTVTGENLYIGDSNLNGHKLSVTGNATMYADVDLQGGEWEVTGNLRQTNGVLFVNGGKLTVDGDYGIYRTQKNSTTGDTEIVNTSGYLKMIKAADTVTVGGDLTVCIYYNTSEYLTAGTLVLKGNFRQIYDGYSTTAYGFCATGTHTTILAGEGTQHITFDSTASQFNNLKLTGDKDTDYVFSREVCWDQIYMNTDVRAVNVYPKDKILTKGTAWKFTAAVAGINKPSQEVTWSVEGASGSRTQISEAGILTVDLHETADTLKVRAVSRQDPQYAGFVTVTLKDAVPVVEWVQITPNHVGLGLGDSKQFEAVVYGENEPEQTVIWQVTGNTSPDTMIDEDGILYIGRDELADSVVIEATSKLDETKKASETVSILRTTISENTIVEKVHVSPQKADVEVGQSRQYKAVVMGVNGPSQDVQWSVSNNSCPSTMVDASGLLTVAEEEESEELTVIATSVENEQIAGTATVSVIRLSILPVADKVIILLKPGDTIALSARVLGANAPSQAVNWRIEGNTSDKTLIDENGVLSIGKNEKTNKITVIAASAENPEIENRVQFDVQPSTCMHTNTEVRNQKESTCLEKGYTGDIFCKDCEDQVGIGNEIPAKGHAWDAGKVVKEATYEEAGIILYTCQTCGAQKQDDLDRLQRPETDEKTQENKKQQTDNGKTDGEQTGQKEKLSGGELIKQKNAEYIVKSDGTVSCGKVKNANGKLTIPDTVQDENGNTYVVSEVGKDAFKDNKSVTEVVIGNKVKTIAVNAFAGCSKLKKVVLGDAVEVISDNAFANCGKLQTVTMKKKVTRIGARAFYKCKSLKKIVIPASVKKIGKQAFYQCKNLRSITIKTTKLTKKRVGSNAFKGIHAKAKIKVPKKKLALYKKVLRSRGVGKKARIAK